MKPPPVLRTPDPSPSSDEGDAKREEARQDRVRQAKAWSIALDPLYGVIAFGLGGYVIDRSAGTWPRWTGILAIVGLIAGFYRFILEATKLNRENTKRWTGRPFRPAEPEEHEPGRDGEN